MPTPPWECPLGRLHRRKSRCTRQSAAVLQVRDFSISRLRARIQLLMRIHCMQSEEVSPSGILPSQQAPLTAASLFHEHRLNVLRKESHMYPFQNWSPASYELKGRQYAIQNCGGSICKIGLVHYFTFYEQSSHRPVHVLSPFVCNRLLQQDINSIKGVLNPALPSIQAFSEDQSPEMRDRIFDEFNSLAVIYLQPSSSFVSGSTSTVLQESVIVSFSAQPFALQ